MRQTEPNPIRIAIQGGYGAFHEMAAFEYFGSDHVEIIPGSTFKQLFKNLANQDADYGIMAIENMVAGSIIPNYKLLDDSNMKIIGEIYLRIKQNLVALPGQSVEQINEVYSHAMALLQCQQFFEKHPHLRTLESEDTALSARKIQKEHLMSVGAIASDQAAERYDLAIIEEGIESNKKNYTRFLILKDQNGEKQKEEEASGSGPEEKRANKSSITFSLSHEIGSLSKVLSLFSFFHINLSKIQSLPIIGRDWEYQFYVDVEFDDYATYQQSLESIQPFTRELKILGEYRRGRSIF